MKWLAMALVLAAAAPAVAVNKAAPPTGTEEAAPGVTASRAVTGAIIIGALVGQATACGHTVKRAHLQRMIEQVSTWATNPQDWKQAKGAVRKTMVAAYQQQRANPKMSCEQVMTLIRAMDLETTEREPDPNN